MSDLVSSLISIGFLHSSEIFINSSALFTFEGGVIITFSRSVFLSLIDNLSSIMFISADFVLVLSLLFSVSTSFSKKLFFCSIIFSMSFSLLEHTDSLTLVAALASFLALAVTPSFIGYT